MPKEMTVFKTNRNVVNNDNFKISRRGESICK